MNPFYLSLLRAMVFSRKPNTAFQWVSEDELPPKSIIFARMRYEMSGHPRPVTYDCGTTYINANSPVPGNVFGLLTVENDPLLPVPLRGANAPLPRGWIIPEIEYGECLNEGTQILLHDPWLPGGWGKFILPHPVPVWTIVYHHALAIKE